MSWYAYSESDLTLTGIPLLEIQGEHMNSCLHPEPSLSLHRIRVLQRPKSRPHPAMLILSKVELDCAMA